RHNARAPAMLRPCVDVRDLRSGMAPSVASGVRPAYPGGVPMAWRMTRTEAAMIAGTPVVYLAVVAWTWPRAQATFAMMALALAYPTAVFTVVLLRRAWIVRLSENFRPCRGTGLLGMGVLTGGLGLVGAAVAPADLAASVLAIGLIVAAVMYALGLLMLPGVAPSWTTRVGRLLDGL